MEQPEITVLSGSGVPPGSAARIAWLAFSDQHLSAGPMTDIRQYKPFWTRVALVIKAKWSAAHAYEIISVPNPLEDFWYDGEFADCVATFGEKHCAAEKAVGVSNGDTFDPFAVTHDGEVEDPDDEDSQVVKMIKIIAAHRRFIEAIRAHIRLPNGYWVFVKGNHDQSLDLDGVQQVIIDYLTDGDPLLAAKIFFADKKVAYEYFEEGVLFKHGNDAEPHNAIKPETSIVTERFGVKLKRPMMNKPIGSELAIRLSNRIKIRNALVGRTRKERIVWLNAILFKWLWGLFSGRILVLFYVWLLSHPSWTRVKTSFQGIWSTIDPYEVKPYAEKERERTGAKVVVMGHNHTADKDEWYLNSGTWTKQFRIEGEDEHPFAKHLFKIAFATFTLFGVMATFLPQYVDPEDRFRWLVGIAIALSSFPTVRGIFHLFTKEPKVIEDPKLTFVEIALLADGELKKDLLIYDQVTREIREYI